MSDLLKAAAAGKAKRAAGSCPACGTVAASLDGLGWHVVRSGACLAALADRMATAGVTGEQVTHIATLRRKPFSDSVCAKVGQLVLGMGGATATADGPTDGPTPTPAAVAKVAKRRAAAAERRA